jgi:predicted nucleotidyltransferase
MKIQTEVGYPTIMHEQASKAIVNHFSTLPEVEAVILYGSCARNKAAEDSCLDILVLLSPRDLENKKAMLKERWNEYYETDEVFKDLRQVGRYSHVDLDFIDGNFVPKYHGWTSGPDEFELEIGNTLVYGIPLWQQGNRLEYLKSKWLPYYDDILQSKRLTMVKDFCKNNLDHIPLFAKRELYFQSFDRFYNAFQEFMQALFISRRIYPIAYDKWIQEQLEEILKLPDLYKSLLQLFDSRELIGGDIVQKAKDLESLLEEYVEE